MTVSKNMSLHQGNASGHQRSEDLFQLITPNWKEGHVLWKWWWDLHAYGLASFFFLLASYSLLTIVSLRTLRLTSRPLLLTINIFLTLFGVSRTIYLFLDPYGSRHILPPVAALLFHEFSFPCLTSAFSLIQLAFARLTKSSVIRPLRCVRALATLIGIHFFAWAACIIAAVSWTPFHPLLLTYHLLSVIWGLILSWSFCQAGERMMRVTRVRAGNKGPGSSRDSDEKRSGSSQHQQATGSGTLSPPAMKMPKIKITDENEQTVSVASESWSNNHQLDEGHVYVDDDGYESQMITASILLDSVFSEMGISVCLDDDGPSFRRASSSSHRSRHSMSLHPLPRRSSRHMSTGTSGNPSRHGRRRRSSALHALQCAVGKGKECGTCGGSDPSCDTYKQHPQIAISVTPAPAEVEKDIKVDGEVINAPEIYDAMLPAAPSSSSCTTSPPSSSVVTSAPSLNIKNNGKGRERSDSKQPMISIDADDFSDTQTADRCKHKVGEEEDVNTDVGKNDKKCTAASQNIKDDESNNDDLVGVMHKYEHQHIRHGVNDRYTAFVPPSHVLRQQRSANKSKLRIVLIVTYLSTVLCVLLCIFTAYYTISIFVDILLPIYTDPWHWFFFQIIFRIIELAMGCSIAYVTKQPINKHQFVQNKATNKKNNGASKRFPEVAAVAAMAAAAVAVIGGSGGGGATNNEQVDGSQNVESVPVPGRREPPSNVERGSEQRLLVNRNRNRHSRGQQKKQHLHLL